MKLDVESLALKLKKYNQEHLLQFWDVISDEQRLSLFTDLKSIDFDDVCSTFHETVHKKSEGEINDDLLEPLCGNVHSGIKQSSLEQLEEYRERGW